MAINDGDLEEPGRRRCIRIPRPTMDTADTPGKRVEGPGSPEPGKKEPEWPENEGWTCWCGWARVTGPTPYWSDSPIGHVGPLVITLNNAQLMNSF